MKAKGRPPLPEGERADRQPRPLFLKLTPAEREVIDEAAAIDERPPSRGETLLKAARRPIKA